MIRKKSKYSRPKKAFEITRIKEENALLKKYALKSKLEVWKSIAKVDYYRRRAKALAKSPMEEQQVLFNKLKALGLKTDTITDVLALKIENLLDRRLSTILFKKGFAKTTQEARQMIVHKRIMIDNKVVNSPSFLVPVSQEDLISLKKKSKPKPKPAETKEVKEPKPTEKPGEAPKAEEKPKIKEGDMSGNLGSIHKEETKPEAKESKESKEAKK